MVIAARELPTRRVGPVPFRIAPLDAAVAAIADSAADRAGLAVHFANAYTVALADSDPGYAALLSDPRSVVFSDGVPVTWIGRRAFPEVAGEWQRVYGPDLMTGLFDRCQAEGLPIRHYFLGATPDTLATLRESVGARWPGLRVAGAASPPFRPMTPQEVREQDERIARSGADVVWVGLGTPKQDWEVARLAGALPVTALAVGAAFDFLAGTKPQAPVWMQRNGTEWAYRLATEPRRLWRRYLWGNPRFLLAASRSPGLRRH